MLIRLLMLYVVYFATGGRGKASAKGKAKSKAKGQPTRRSAKLDAEFQQRHGRQPLKAFEVLQDDFPAIAAAAGTTTIELGEVPVNESEQNWGVYRIAITSPAAVTGNNSNSGTINVRQMRGGVAQATIATLALVTGVNLAADVPTVIPITGSPVLAAGDVLDVQYVQIGTGLAMPANTNIKAEIA